MLRLPLSLALVATLAACDGRPEPDTPSPDDEPVRLDRGLGSWPKIERVDGGQRVRFELWSEHVGSPDPLEVRLESRSPDQELDFGIGSAGIALYATVPIATACYRIAWHGHSLWLSNAAALESDDPWLDLPDLAEPTLQAPLAERTFRGPGFVARLTIEPLSPDFRPIGAFYTWRITCTPPCRSASFRYSTADGASATGDACDLYTGHYSTVFVPRTLETPEAFTLHGLVTRDAIDVSLCVDRHTIRIAPRLTPGVRTEAHAYFGHTTLVGGRDWRDATASP